MLRVHVFSIFTIKTPRALAGIAPLGLLIVKTLTNVLSLLLNHYGTNTIVYEWNSLSG